LYISNSDHSITISENGNANIKNYVDCCNTLNNSILKHGYYLTVLINKPEKILKYGYEIEVKK
jgi:hypothetical protein